MLGFGSIGGDAVGEAGPSAARSGDERRRDEACEKETIHGAIIGDSRRGVEARRRQSGEGSRMPRPCQFAMALNFNGGDCRRRRSWPDIGSPEGVARASRRERAERLVAASSRWSFSIPARRERDGGPRGEPKSECGSELEHIHHVADRRRIRRDVRVLARLRVRQIVATAAADRRQSPIRLNELQRRDMVRMGVVDMAVQPRAHTHVSSAEDSRRIPRDQV